LFKKVVAKSRQPSRQKSVYFKESSSDLSDDETQNSSRKHSSKLQKSTKIFADICFSRLKRLSGSKENKAQEFFETFEHLAKLHRVPIDEQASTLAEMLIGNALKMYKNLNQQKQESYPELKSALVQNFVLKDNPILIRSTYNKRRQAQNESVQ